MEKSLNSLQIKGGYDGNIADLNYQVSVQMFHRGSYKHFCGGSIIAASHIISAAHCYDNNIFNFYGVRAGSNTTKSGGQFRSVLSTQVHPSYDSMTIDYDVAILKLRTPLNFGALVQPIPLAPLGKFIDAKVRATVSGWGATRV
uniref:CSON001567 protein n=1 Tax=Culicoides sonorensis TaxID=179676 RepID=A0A336LVY3_CULSO